MKKLAHQLTAAIAITFTTAIAAAAEAPGLATAASGAASSSWDPVAHLKQAPAYYRVQVGDFVVTALSDGTIPLPLDRMMRNITPEDVRKLATENFEAIPLETSINAFVIDTGTRRILIDAGAGNVFGRYGGKLVSNLRAAGYAPEDISAVLLTHLHGDHSSGLTVEGQRVFPNATVYLDKADRDYRFSDAAQAAAPDNQKKMFTQSRADLAPYEAAAKVVLFSGAVQLFPGVATIPAHGHTPGHTLYSVESRGERMVFSGDLVHAPEIQMARPEATIQFDADEASAASDRRIMLERFANDRTLLAAAHIPFPGIGHVRKRGDAYEWIPQAYSLRGMAQ